MDFKKIILIAYAFSLLACTDGPLSQDDEFLIGDKLSALSDISGQTNSSSQTIALFDENTDVIHQFDLEKMKHIRAIDVKHKKLPHFVLYSGAGGYVIDLTTRHISVYDQQGNAFHDPVSFYGTPVSAAFRPDLGYVVVYDDNSSVSILKLNANGAPLNAWVSGPIVSGGHSIVSGDINDDSELILALSDGSIARVDIEQSLTDKTWTFTSVASPYQNIKWLSPIPGSPEQILMKSDNKISLFDLNTASPLSEIDINSTETSILKYSRRVDPHLLYKEADDKKKTIVYVEAGALKTKDLYNDFGLILSSHLNISNNSWSVVNSQKSEASFDYEYNLMNKNKQDRGLTKFDFDTLLVTQKLDIKDDVQIELANNFIFSLYPSELGFATKRGIDDKSYQEVKLFNLSSLR